MHVGAVGLGRDALQLGFVHAVRHANGIDLEVAFVTVTQQEGVPAGV